ncbi:MAG: methylmalonyl-CoA mutase family protein, partial [Actinomycetota bacterium]|nr:methylmalonyl-CoA mutase family protein [Actinomycetota bacterium]
MSPPEEVTAPEALSLAAGFPQADRGQWQELVAGVLRRSGSGVASGPAEDSLRTSVGSGIEIAPLYVAEDAADLPKQVGVPGLAPFVRGRRAGLPEHTGWDVRARHAHPDVEVTRQAIAADLHNGVTSLWLVLGPGAIPAQALPEVLDGVLLDVAPIVLQAGSATLQVADCYFELAASQGVKAGELLGNLGADPYGDAIRTDSDLDVSVAVSLARRCHDNFPHLRAIVVD